MDYFVRIILLEATWSCAFQVQQATDDILNSEYAKAAIRIDSVVGDLQDIAENLRSPTRREENVRRPAIATF